MSKSFRICRLASSSHLQRRQKEVFRCLGLRKIGSEVVVKDNPAVRGQILKVQHLVRVSVEKENKE